MISTDQLEKEYKEYLDYLYKLCDRYYSDCPEIDSLVQDSLTALLLKLDCGEAVEHPKGFLSAVLKNKHNAYLRNKYKTKIVEYTDIAFASSSIDFDPQDEIETKNSEYEAVRREIGRLISIYREVTVRHYFHGQSVEQISKELNIPRGTVLSRLSASRDQIKEGIKNMEKYSKASYEPKSATIGIWGYVGLNGEPFTCIRSPIEANIIDIAYEKPLSVRSIADAMGIPTAYLEPFIETLISNELLGRTPGGLVYTRCFVQKYSSAFGDIPRQERLAEEYAFSVWNIVWKHLNPLTERAEFAEMSDKQKATFILFIMNQMLNNVISNSNPYKNDAPKQPPERPDGGRWLATVTVYEHGQKRDNKYERSGPVIVKLDEGCRMFDCQSLFGDAHWGYERFKYRCSLQSILRFYASFLPTGIKTDNNLLYELIPSFEELCILKRDENGKVMLDIPALTVKELKEHWAPACKKIEAELFDLLHEGLERLILSHKNRVPQNIDEAEYFSHIGATDAYTKAQLLAIVNQNLLPYQITVGKTPLILIAYNRNDL